MKTSIVILLFGVLSVQSSYGNEHRTAYFLTQPDKTPMKNGKWGKKVDSSKIRKMIHELIRDRQDMGSFFLPEHFQAIYAKMIELNKKFSLYIPENREETHPSCRTGRYHSFIEKRAFSRINMYICYRETKTDDFDERLVDIVILNLARYASNGGLCEILGIHVNLHLPLLNSKPPRRKIAHWPWANYHCGIGHNEMHR